MKALGGTKVQVIGDKMLVTIRDLAGEEEGFGFHHFALPALCPFTIDLGTSDFLTSPFPFFTLFHGPIRNHPNPIREG